MKNAVLFVNLPSKHPVLAVKYQEMTAFPSKGNAYIIFIYIAFSNGQNKVLLKTVLSAERNGLSKTDQDQLYFV